MALASLSLAALLALPLAPAPPAPFPKILTDAPTITDVAPGVKLGDYEMNTADGPLSVHVVAVDLNEPTIRIGTALANDALISQGETVSSMARRTGAVAGINGDYFDIDQTNQPLNILIENGRLLRMPAQRFAVAFSPEKAVQFAEFAVGETAILPGGTIPLKTMNLWPPPGEGAVFITPEYGPLRAAENVTEFALEPVGTAPPLTTYRVTQIADNGVAQPAGYYLALGADAYGTVPLPNPGDTIAISADGTPRLDAVASAIGGGPLLVKDGAWYADPDGPSKGEFETHVPLSGIALTRSGALLLVTVDGRQPDLSVGLTQRQFASLLIGFGSVTGMQFDGGGSSTIVARVPGQQDASVRNSPSDGKERHVADGLFVYSDAPLGPPARVYSFPQAVRALPGARVPLRVAVTDAGGHPVNRCPCATHMSVIPGSAGAIDGNTFVAGKKVQDAVIRVESAGLRMDVPVHVTTSVARTEILPEHPALRAGERLQLQARAFDAQGFPIAIPGSLAWSARNGAVNSSGMLQVRATDAQVAVRLGDKVAHSLVTVGEHAQEIALAGRAMFATAPRNGPGSLAKDDPCRGCLTLHYDFAGKARAAYANASIVLPQRALGLSADVYGDGNGETLRLAVNNAINERFLYTIAKVDWRGWRHVEYRFPPALPQPITFKSIYVIDRVGPGPAVETAGAVSLRNVRVLLAGSATKRPK